MTTVISSPRQIGMVMDADHDHTLEELTPFLSGVDIILAEGYKRENKPKMELFRPEVHSKPLCLNDGNLIAMITDSGLDPGVPKFATDDIKQIIEEMELGKGHTKFGCSIGEMEEWVDLVSQP